MEVINYNSVEDWKKEIAVMSQNRCRYTVEIYGYCANQNILTIVMEFMAKGDLYGILHKKKEPLSLLQRTRMARQCALGLSFLHTNHVMHRDIKSMNILVTDLYECKLTDFGCAKLVSDRQIYNTYNTGTPLWMAPEVKRGLYTFSADVYSLGLVFYELFEKQLPGWNEMTQTIVLPQQFKSIPVVYPLIHPTPERRPTASQVVHQLDEMIHHIVEGVKNLLKPEDQEKVKTGSQATLNSDIDIDPLEADLLHIYNILLNKPAEEVDALIDKAFSQSNKTNQTPTKH
eukprot:TRINITY_DN361_c0_g1_i1.p1 TRINITY_DN361_c0_g1~~TRINITY_DN361_c0_g1_i1.p1  ORF type:complete len:287 (-),score=58.61 TRINITY_DN361_c0_g1_i1:124-984(-)